MPTEPKFDRIISWIVGGVFLISLIEVFFRTVGFTEWTSLQKVPFIKHNIYGTFQKSNMKIRRFNPKNYDVINTTNSMGFRDSEHNFASRDLRGIWMAGGSNSYAGYVDDDEPFSAQIENYGYVAANLSSENHFPYSQAKVIRHLAAQGYKPQAIILELTLNNAIRDMRPYLNDFEKRIEPFKKESVLTVIENSSSKMFLENILAVVKSSYPSWQDIKSRLINNSATYGWLKVGVNKNETLRELTLKLGLRANVNLVWNAPVEAMRHMENNPTEVYYDSTTKFIIKLDKWIKYNLDVPFGVLLIPDFRHLYPNRFKEFVEFYGLQDLKLDPSLPLRRLKSKLNSFGIKTLDVTQFLSSSDQENLIFPDDGHMNAAAHRIIAAALADWLQNSMGISPNK